MSSESQVESRIQTACLVVLSIIAIATALMWLRPVMIPFVLALFFTLILNPLVDFQIKWFKFPHSLAILSTLIIGIIILILMGLLVTSSVEEMVNNADTYQAKVTKVLNKVTETSRQEIFGVNIKAALKPFLDNLGNRVGTILVSTVNAILSILKQSVLVFIFILFLLVGSQKQKPSTNPDILEGQRRIEHYIATKFMISALTGTLVGLVLFILHIDLALVFGLFAFILNFIPSIGSIIATLLPIPVVLVSPGISPLTAALAIIIPGCIQFIVGNVIEPKIMGQSLDLHPVTVLMALIFWGMIWGVVGMFLAIPLTAILKIILDKLEITKPVSNLLSGRID